MKYRVRIKEARWHTVTYEVDSSEYEEGVTLEEIEEDPHHYEPDDANWVEGDVLSVHGDVTVEEIPEK